MKKDNRNVEAESSIINGFVYSIPAALVGGIFGAIVSIGLGLFSAKRKIDKQKKGAEFAEKHSIDVVQDVFTDMSDKEIEDKIIDLMLNTDVENKNSVILGKEYSPRMFIRKYNECKNAPDFKKFYYYITDEKIYCGFYAEGKCILVDKNTSYKILFAKQK